MQMHRLFTTTVEISIRVTSLVIFFVKHCLGSKSKLFICSWEKSFCNTSCQNSFRLVSMGAIGGSVAEGSECPEGVLSHGHMTSVPAWGGDFRAVTARGAFGGGSVTTAPHCSHSEVITLWKFNWSAWHLSELLTQAYLEINQALTQQHLLTSATKWEIATFKEDEVWEEGKGNE